MDSTKSYLKIYNISPELAEDFEFDYDTAGIEEGGSDILTELVPNLDQWGDIGWMEVEEYEYNSHNNTMHFTLETKWAPPVRWLQQASYNCSYFENKLVSMATIQKDETCVTGVVVMDGEVLQNKYIFQMELDEVEKYYSEDDEYELDELDNQIWDSIGKFRNICEQFYLERDNEND